MKLVYTMFNMQFIEYPGAHSNLSSTVEILPELGVLRKTRADRSEGNLKNEFRALIASDILLSHYDDEHMPVNIQSPYPYSCNIPNRSIDMEFVRGGTVGAMIAHTFPDHVVIDKKVIFSDIAFGLGRYAAIKSREKFVHGDYSNRHVLYNPLAAETQEPAMSIIDVESMRPTTDNSEIDHENIKMLNWLLSTCQSSPRITTIANRMYGEGLHSLPSDAEQVWEDVVHTMRDEG